MIIPLSHEGPEGRSLPYATIAFILLNVLAFLATHSAIENETLQIGGLEMRILVIAAAHPDVKPPASVQPLVNAFAQENKERWDRMRSGARAATSWECNECGWGPAQSASELAQLATQLLQVQSQSILDRFAFYPYRPTLISLFTANFLHGGWLHLIFNMWFLWLSGGLLEEVWGSLVYSIFYLAAGVAGLLAHALSYPHSIVPVLGASGAIAGLIGAFLIRFPQIRINFLVIWLQIFRFSSPAYLILPFWLLLQVVWGTLGGSNSGVAYWAHIGGFLLGMVVAAGLQRIGMERPLELREEF